MYLIIFSVFIVGLLTKLADVMTEDGLKPKWFLSYPVGVLYGILGTYILLADAILAPIVLATVAAVLITRKIDSKPHSFAIATMFLLLAVWGFPSVNLALLAIFFAVEVIGEIGNDLADKEKMDGWVKRFFSLRLLSDATAFLVSLLTGQWIIFIGMICFTIGYGIIEVSEKRISGWF